MPEQPSILVVDDGELGDVCEILRELDAEFEHLRGGQIPGRVEPPRDLLVSAPRHALEVARCGIGDAEPGRPSGVVIVSEDSPALRSLLRQAGYDFLVRRPVHRSALRLLLLRALYRGPERRTDFRLPSGCHISFRMGIKRHTCVLADLSTGGCRLLTTRPVEPGTQLEVRLTRDATGSEEIDLPGTAVRCSTGEALAGFAAGYSVGVRFDGADEHSRARLRAVTMLRRVGAHEIDEQRRHERQSFRETVSALCAEADRVLMGRDLSAGGMKVEHHPDLHLHQKLRLALHVEGEEEPAVVDAVVVRDDGADGIALRFEAVPRDLAEKLERLVADLPSVEFLCKDEPAGLGAVLSEVISASDAPD